MHRLQLQDPVQIGDYRYRDCSILYGKCPMGKTHRTDKGGGSLPNRARLPIEVAEAVAAVWGAARVGYRISPHFQRYSMSIPASNNLCLSRLKRDLLLLFDRYSEAR